MIQKGFILPLAIIIIFSISALVTRLLVRSTSLIPVRQYVIDREKAKQAALLGVTAVQAKLTAKFKTEKEKQEWYQQLLLGLHKWYSLSLKENVDGIDATLQIYMSVEDGKIPLNALWDFKNKKFIGADKVDVKALLAHISFQQRGDKGKERNVVEELERVLKKYDQPLEDITQLFDDPYFKGLSYHWVSTPADEKDTTTGKNTLLFSDVFTVTHNTLNIQPLFLSPDVKKGFELQQFSSDEKKREEQIKKITSSLKDTVDWAKQWNELVAGVYGKKYEQVVPAFSKIFNPAIGASVISVVSYGKVGTVTEKVLALLSRSESDGRVTYTIRKLYWL